MIGCSMVESVRSDKQAQEKHENENLCSFLYTTGASELQHPLRRLHNLQPGGSDDFSILTADEILKYLSAFMRRIAIRDWMAGVSLQVTDNQPY